MAKIKTVTARGSRLAQLKALAKVLAAGIDSCQDPRTLPALARQYRETIREIEDAEGVRPDGDEIGRLLAAREAEGEPAAH